MPRADIESDFTKLTAEKWEVSSAIDDGYNCIAFAVHDTQQFWDPSMVGVRGYYWPPGIPRDWRVTTLIKLYEIHGFRKCDSLTLEKEFEKIVIYSTSSDAGTHAARQKRSGVWTSKLGSCEDIEHESAEGLEGITYGNVTVIMKRRLAPSKKTRFNPLRLVKSMWTRLWSK
jgi:hypothetical protein